MNLEEIIKLLMGKAPQARKDGLEQMARAIKAFNHTDEEIKAAAEKVTAEDINSFIQEWRRNADAEITKATQTAEKNLRDKYDLVEKTQQEPKPKDQQNLEGALTPDLVKQMVTEAVKAATEGISKEVSGFKNEQLQAARREALRATFADNVPGGYKDAVLAGFEGRSFADDAAFNAYMEQVKTDTAAFMQDMADRGLREQDKPVFGAVNDKTGVSTAVESFIQAQAEEKKDLGGKAL